MHNIIKNNGFTLLEVLFAVFIVFIGMFAVMGLITVIIKGTTLSSSTTEATSIAQEEIERIKNMAYDQVTDTATTTGKYLIDVKVGPDSPTTDTKTVTVNVYWGPGTTTSTHNVGLSYIIAE